MSGRPIKRTLRERTATLGSRTSGYHGQARVENAFSATSPSSETAFERAARRAGD